MLLAFFIATFGAGAYLFAAFFIRIIVGLNGLVTQGLGSPLAQSNTFIDLLIFGPALVIFFLVFNLVVNSKE